MSGHSKWANIKRKKEVNDKERSKIFGKLSRLITLSVIQGAGIGDPTNNVRLRLMIDKAKAANLPKENIERAIEKASGPEKNNLREVVYEGFGPLGTTFMIEATTDNPNRTIGEIRNTLETNGGKLGSQGSVSYLYNKCGKITFLRRQNSEDDLFIFAEKIQAQDMEEDEERLIVYCPYENMNKVKELLGNLVIENEEIDYRPLSTVNIDNEEEGKKVIGLIELLEDLDDVHNVYTNLAVLSY